MDINALDKMVLRRYIPYERMELAMSEGLPEGQMFFTLQEVAEYLKISISSLHRWRRDGKFSPTKPGQGKQWRVHRAEVVRLAGLTEPLTTHDPLIMPDEGHGIRRPWVDLMESRDMAEFVELRIVKMSLDEADPDEMVALAHGFTTQELIEYRQALDRVIAVTGQVLRTREEPPAC